MRHVDLCSGIGGFALGFEWAKLSTPALFCDIEPWSRQILAKYWPDVPIADDVKELARDPERLVPDHDIITAGYPCQPFSMAGHRRGEEDDRHIWPEIFSIVQAKRPRWCVFENVFGHVSMGLDQVLSDLESKNYSCQAFIIPACALDAPHRRDRVWIVANTDSIPDAVDRRNRPIEKESLVRGDHQSRSGSNAGRIIGAGQNETDGETAPHSDSSSQSNGTIHEQRMEQATRDDTHAHGKRPYRAHQHQHRNAESLDRQECEPGQVREILAGRGNTEEWEPSNVADNNSAGLQGQRTQSIRTGEEQCHSGDTCRWLPEPPVGRVANGIPGRVDRLRGLGNAIVPQVAMQIGLTIRNVENGTTI